MQLDQNTIIGKIILYQTLYQIILKANIDKYFKKILVNIQNFNSNQNISRIIQPKQSIMQLFLKSLVVVILILPVFNKFDPSIMHVIDSQAVTFDNGSSSQYSNYLIRGNLPISHHKFQFKQLKKQLKKMTGLKQFRLVVISLMNSLTGKQSNNRRIQAQYFKNKKKIGSTKIQYINYIVIGSLINPGSVPQLVRNFMLTSYQYISFDRVHELMKILKKRMNSSKPTIIYLHCSAGIDRTGYISGIYKMKNFGWSLKKVMKQNLGIMQKKRLHMHFNTYNGLQWYCLYLGRSQKQCLIGQQQPKLHQI